MQVPHRAASTCLRQLLRLNSSAEAEPPFPLLNAALEPVYSFQKRSSIKFQPAGTAWSLTEAIMPGWPQA